VPTTVWNDGTLDASDVLVRYYAGDPGQGGNPVHDEIFASVPAGGSASQDVQLIVFPNTGTVTIFAVVDPDDDIAECNDGNNEDSADDTITCNIVN